jgi:BirA family biotin operon repressor/biotin-[acetyl-CoA-carboxylase] ligase
MSTHPALVPQVEERLAIEHIRRTLATERIGFQLYLFGEVGSTNTVLRRLADTGAPDGTVVLAETQTMGRGRLGKPWFSPPGLNLYASVLFRPASPPSAVPVFSFISSLALTDAIWAEGLPAEIKWPNDVLVDGRKVAGTLAAYASAGDVVEYVILGIGVNLNVDHATLAGALGPAAAAATSLREAAGRLIDRNAFTAAFLNLLEKWDNEYRAHGSNAVLEAWRERDALADHLVEVRGSADTYRGRAIGVNREGRLVVEEVRGARREIVTGEIVILE